MEKNTAMCSEWARFKPWQDVGPDQFEDNAWQDRNAISRISQLKTVLDGIISPDLMDEIEAGLSKTGMSIRLNPYMICRIDWSDAENDPLRRQFLPMRCEQENDHPCLEIDSLAERRHSPVTGIVHRYPDKVLFLVTSVCPVYCQYCTRSYAVGQDTQLVQKDHVTSAQNWVPALDYIRSNSQIEDVVVSGGDLARLKPAHVRSLGSALLEIDHVRRIRLATKALSVQPMKFLSDHDWMNAVLELFTRGRSMFKDVFLHTHFNHPNEVTPIVERAMRRLHEHGVFVRNQTVLLRGVNDDAGTLHALVKRLGRLNIHPYYVYLCDMVKATEHFRLPLSTAQRLEKHLRGATAGFNTPLFIVDTPSGKRDVHSSEFHDGEYGVSAFISPAVSEETCYYYDPVRSLGQAARAEWAAPDARAAILARIAANAQASIEAPVANGKHSIGHRKRIRRSSATDMRSHAQLELRARYCSQPLRAGHATSGSGRGPRRASPN
ncbi:MAG TPA: KamA family radical SAM protein [Xanthobacteraceae bacterium]